jgi:hypothetical protein
VAERERNAAEAARLWARNVALADAWLANEPTHPEIRKDRDAAQANVDRLRAGKLAPTAPTDVALQFKVTRVAPRKLEVEGTCNVLNLSRVNLRFQDKDYQARSRTFDAKMNDCTLEWDNAPVKQGKFEHLLDLDRDPADMERQPSEIYPLHAQEYELTVSFNPRLQAAFIQDLYGWNGEGITAAPDMLKVDAAHPGVMDGKRTPLRYVAKTIILKRADVVGAGKKQLYP